MLAQALRQRGHHVQGFVRTVSCLVHGKEGVQLAYAKEQDQYALMIDGALWTRDGRRSWPQVLRQSAEFLTRGSDGYYAMHFKGEPRPQPPSDLVVSNQEQELLGVPGVWEGSHKPILPRVAPMKPFMVVDAPPIANLEAGKALEALQLAGVKWNDAVVFKGLAAVLSERGVLVRLLAREVAYSDDQMMARMRCFELDFPSIGSSLLISAPAQASQLPEYVAKMSDTFEETLVQVSDVVKVTFAPTDKKAFLDRVEKAQANVQLEAWIAQCVALALNPEVAPKPSAPLRSRL